MADIQILEKEYQDTANQAIVPLTVQMVDGVPRVSSRAIATARGKLHTHVLAKIDALIALDPTMAGTNFRSGAYLDANGQERPEYLCDEEGSYVLCMSLGGKGGLDAKRRVTKAFLAYRGQLRANDLQPIAQVDLFRQMALAMQELQDRDSRIEQVANKALSLATRKASGARSAYVPLDVPATLSLLVSRADALPVRAAEMVRSFDAQVKRGFFLSSKQLSVLRNIASGSNNAVFVGHPA